ncbi:MAG: VOC family protein, partial [Bdellovibrionia bacterium]
MQKIHTCLWFDHEAEEAAQFYVSLFKNSKVGRIARYGQSGSEVSGQKKGSVMTAEFDIDGQHFMGLNGGDHYKFSPAASLMVWCKDETEIDGLWAKLKQGGSVLMELNKYPWAEKYGWCQDRFGLSWQLMIGENRQKIAPALLFTDEKFG